MSNTPQSSSKNKSTSKTKAHFKDRSDRKRGSRGAELKDKEKYQGMKHKFTVAIKKNHPSPLPPAADTHSSAVL